MRLWATTERTVHHTELPAEAARAIQDLSARQINEDEAGAAVGSGTLLVRDAEGNFSFLHQSVMEWLVAKSAAGELASKGRSDALDGREMSPLMAEFFGALATKDMAVAWARRVLLGERAAGKAGRPNALLVLGRLGVPGLRGVKLSGQDLRGKDFAGLDLRDADLSGADLRAASLVAADLTGARLWNANLMGADLSRATLGRADLMGADLSHARLLGAKLRGAKLSATRLRYAKLSGADLDEEAVVGMDTFGAAPAQLTPAAAVPAPARFCNAVAWSRDGALVASGHEGGVVCVWDAATGTMIRTLQGQSGAVRSVAFSPDGRTLASGSGDKTIVLWDMGSGASRGTLQGQSGAVRSVAFSPDGRTLASGSGDNTIGLWDVGSGASRGTLQGQSGAVRSVAFSPDGRTLASGSDDGTIRLWDVATGACLAVLIPRPGGWAAFTPDGRYKLAGDIAGAFWFVAGLCRFEPGELDPYVPGIQRIPDDEPLIPPPRSPAPLP
jgi:hypothetical protein